MKVATEWERGQQPWVWVNGRKYVRSDVLDAWCGGEGRSGVSAERKDTDGVGKGLDGMQLVTTWAGLNLSKAKSCCTLSFRLLVYWCPCGCVAPLPSDVRANWHVAVSQWTWQIRRRAATNYEWILGSFGTALRRRTSSGEWKEECAQSTHMQSVEHEICLCQCPPINHLLSFSFSSIFRASFYFHPFVRLPCNRIRMCPCWQLPLLAAYSHLYPICTRIVIRSYFLCPTFSPKQLF